MNNSISLVIASSQGEIYRISNFERIDDPDYNEEGESSNSIDYEEPIVAIWFDQEGKEGLVGTVAGCIHYVNLIITQGEAQPAIRLVASNNNNNDAITYCKYDPHNPALIATACGKKSAAFKLYTSQNCDQVHTYEGNYEEEGRVVFVVT